MNEEVKNQLHDLLVDINHNGLTWKPRKDVYHLNKRKVRGHIPGDFKLKDYIALIMNILRDKETDIYIYFKQTFGQNYFVFADGGTWIVILGEDGIIETAMIADNYINYLDSAKGYRFIGKIKEVFA